jgi:hypothetical protein
MSQPNQARDIYDFIKANPDTCALEIADGTGWNLYVVNITLAQMILRGLIEESGRTKWDEAKFRLKPEPELMGLELVVALVAILIAAYDEFGKHHAIPAEAALAAAIRFHLTVVLAIERQNQLSPGQQVALRDSVLESFRTALENEPTPNMKGESK